MNVRMRPGERVATVLAGAARSGLKPRAEQALSEPEREPLLADAERPVQQQRPGKRIAADRVVEALEEGLVAVKGEQWHDAR